MSVGSEDPECYGMGSGVSLNGVGRLKSTNGLEPVIRLTSRESAKHRDESRCSSLKAA
jgi:hypothetical protein